MLTDAQKATVVNQLNSGAWTRSTVKHWFENNGPDAVVTPRYVTNARGSEGTQGVAWSARCG
jgi:hypothetical protein